MIGTACASLAVYQSLPSSILLNFLYLAILLFEAVYTVMLYGKLKEQGMIPGRELSHASLFDALRSVQQRIDGLDFHTHLKEQFYVNFCLGSRLMA
jgi:hypothetical protein